MGGAQHDEPVTPTPRFPRTTGKRLKDSGAHAYDTAAPADDERATPTRTPKESGIAPRMPSDPPAERTRLPSEVRSRLPADPAEAARDPRVCAMRELYAAGDTDAALFIAQTIDPSPPDRVSLTAETLRPPPTSREQLAAAFTADRVPRVILATEEIADLPLDHRAGFLLAHIDGMSSMEQILDICAMPESEAIFIFRQLLVMGVIVFGHRGK